MGKKHKTHKLNSTISPAKKTEISTHVTTLLEKCSKPGAPDWTEFLEINTLLENITNLQKDFTLVKHNRADGLTTFRDWLGSVFPMKSIRIHEFEESGMGLLASQAIQEHELFLSVPRKYMLTTRTAGSSCLGKLIKQDKMLKVMPNVVLALHLLCEYSNKESFWAPYLKFLPESYSTPLYFNPQEIEILKGSPAYGECLSLYKNIARQYAYLYNLFQTHPESRTVPVKNCFCYEDYRWAVSSVMTRQNQIPASDGIARVNALIPLWDMCNHKQGQLTTDFNLKEDSLVCFSPREYKEEQIYIFYGPRSNAELFVHSGFVDMDNQFDTVTVKLGVSKNDPLYVLKSQLLTRCEIDVAGNFYLQSGPVPVEFNLMAFLRVFSMDEESLKRYLDDVTLLPGIGDLDKPVSKDLEMKACSFLETRTALLRKIYKTTLEEDKRTLADPEISERRRIATQLLMSEKQILVNTAEFAAKRKLDLAETIPGLVTQE